MKAVQQHAFGGPEVLSYEDAPMPVLQAGEVLVQVHAVGVNPPDSYLRDGYQQLPPEWRPEVRFPLILGTDLSGVVVARADDVREVAVGDEVYAMARFPEGAGRTVSSGGAKGERRKPRSVESHQRGPGKAGKSRKPGELSDR